MSDQQVWFDRQYAEQVENLRTVFRLYITWFIFFWTINVTILTALFSNKGNAHSILQASDVVIWLFVVLNCLGIGVCYAVWCSMNESRCNALEIAETVGNFFGTPFNQFLITYACGGGAASMAANIVCWLLLLLYS